MGNVDSRAGSGQKWHGPSPVRGQGAKKRLGTMKNLKGVLALLLILYLIASSNNHYSTNKADFNTATEAIDRGRIHLMNAADTNKKRKKRRWREHRKNHRNK